MPPLNIILIIALLTLIVLGSVIYSVTKKKSAIDKRILNQPFPDNWRSILYQNVKFYQALDEVQKGVFEKRVQTFLASKKITPIDTEIDDFVRLMVAVSAIIPVNSFPEFNYPHLREILIYPNSFDQKFRTNRYLGHEENVIGMVGNRFMNGEMIISKPDLERAYNGDYHKSNVGIHEFAHLIDGIDGATDGIPEILMKKSDIAPWLHIIEEERNRIEEGLSDISSYALTNNAEFFAVVSEYFFSDPERFKQNHLDLYKYLSMIYQQTP